MSTRLLAAALVVAVALAAASCRGGDVTGFRLSRDAGTMSSIATEGAVLAHDVVRGEAFANHTEVHAAELAVAAGKVADALGPAHAPPPLRTPTDRLVRLAERVRSALERLEHHASDAAVARGVGAELHAAAAGATRIEAEAG